MFRCPRYCSTTSVSLDKIFAIICIWESYPILIRYFIKIIWRSGRKDDCFQGIEGDECRCFSIIMYSKCSNKNVTMSPVIFIVVGAFYNQPRPVQSSESGICGFFGDCDLTLAGFPEFFSGSPQHSSDDEQECIKNYEQRICNFKAISKGRRPKLASIFLALCSWIFRLWLQIFAWTLWDHDRRLQSFFFSSAPLFSDFMDVAVSCFFGLAQTGVESIAKIAIKKAVKVTNGVRIGNSGYMPSKSIPVSPSTAITAKSNPADMVALASLFAILALDQREPSRSSPCS
jgi:hypothetical protein